MTHLPDSDLRELADLPRAKGVGRDQDNEQCLCVYFERRLDNDELRALHELLARALPSLIADLREMRERLEAIDKAKEKRAPVQGYAPGIPWSMHLRAYDAYCKKWSAQPALIDLEGRGCRGGFGVEELDGFIPGWRDELSELTALKAELAQARARIKELEGKT